MFHVNIFAIPYLVGLVIMSPVAVIFCIMYAKLGKRKLDLLLTIVLICIAAHCVVIFLMANAVPAGIPVHKLAGGMELTLLLLRIAYALGTAAAITMLHFVLAYCRKDNFLRRRIMWVYGAGLLLLPVLWTPWVLRARTEALGHTSSWSCPLPWMPVAGPLAAAYMVIWASAIVYSLLLLWRHHRYAKPDGVSVRTDLLMLGFALVLVGEVLDTLGGGLVWNAKVAATPLAATVTGLLLATALVQERIQAERKKAQINLEMKLASQIQRNLLPDKPPRLAGFDLAGWSRPASQTGGDSYDFMVLDDNRLMVMLGDAAGHGMGAALLIAETHAMLRALALTTQDPAAILSDADGLLAKYRLGRQFVTCFLGVVDPVSSVLTYASAGQGPILFYSRSANRFEQVRATGLPLPLSTSLATGSGSEMSQRRLERGDFVAIVSDGFFEAANASGEQMGVNRLVEVFSRVRHCCAEDMIDALCSEVDRFAGDSEQRDDMTVVVLRKT